MKPTPNAAPKSDHLLSLRAEMLLFAIKRRPLGTSLAFNTTGRPLLSLFEWKFTAQDLRHFGGRREMLSLSNWKQGG